MVRVAFCGISHETNTFATSALGLTGFDTGEGHGGFRPVRGDAVVQRTGGYTGGMVAAANELCEVSNLFGYGEIKPNAWRFRDATMLDVFRRVTAPNFHMLSIERKEDVWPAFRAFLTKEKRPEEAPAEAAAGA